MAREEEGDWGRWGWREKKREKEKGRIKGGGRKWGKRDREWKRVWKMGGDYRMIESYGILDDDETIINQQIVSSSSVILKGCRRKERWRRSQKLIKRYGRRENGRDEDKHKDIARPSPMTVTVAISFFTIYVQKSTKRHR